MRKMRTSIVDSETGQPKPERQEIKTVRSEGYAHSAIGYMVPVRRKPSPAEKSRTGVSEKQGGCSRRSRILYSLPSILNVACDVRYWQEQPRA